jgi:hypothetical protein
MDIKDIRSNILKNKSGLDINEFVKIMTPVYIEQMLGQ